jgi:glycosyltransferase involved in cell wall biosynthesis
MNRRVLLICYYFPPLGLGGVGRPLNLFKRLPNHGWDCDVLTVKPVLYRAYEPELLEGLDPSRIFRSGSRDPQRILYLLGMRKIKAGTISKGRKVSEKFFPDSKVGWVRSAIRLGSKLVRRNNYDAIISSSPPMSSHLIGMELARRFELPLVADFRDFWTIYKAEEEFHTEARRAQARELLAEIKQTAAATTCVNGSIVEYLGTGETLTNGYDPDLAEAWRGEPDVKKFTIGLLGHQHDTRELEPLLSLLERLRDANADCLKRLKILQVGQVDPNWFRRLFEERGLDIELDIRGRQKRADTIGVLSSAHVFFYGITEREGSGFLPGRTFELIASGRPVFAATKDVSEIAGVLNPTGNACCFESDTIDRAVDKLSNLITQFEAGHYEFEPLTEYAAQFSAEALASKFALVLDGVL